ncbi:hypothetical protein [Paenibacillus sp. 2TAB26]
MELEDCLESLIAFFGGSFRFIGGEMLLLRGEDKRFIFAPDNRFIFED